VDFAHPLVGAYWGSNPLPSPRCGILSQRVLVADWKESLLSVAREAQMKVEEIITDRIVKLLEAGTVPWHKPWANRGDDSFPRNAVTKRHYRGINVFILASQSYGSPVWFTFREAERLGGHVRKGEHGTPIIFWKWLRREVEKTNGDVAELHFPMLRYYTVFNAEQTEGCRLPADAKPSDTPPFSPIEACEAVYANMPNRPKLERGATVAITRGRRFEAYYTTGSDMVVMPRCEAFDSPEFYYSVLFHELTHSTGAVHRLNRVNAQSCLAVRRHELWQGRIGRRNGCGIPERTHWHRASHAFEECGVSGQLD